MCRTAYEVSVTSDSVVFVMLVTPIVEGAVRNVSVWGKIM